MFRILSVEEHVDGLNEVEHWWRSLSWDSKNKVKSTIEGLSNIEREEGTLHSYYNLETGKEEYIVYFSDGRWKYEEVIDED